MVLPSTVNFISLPPTFTVIVSPAIELIVPRAVLFCAADGRGKASTTARTNSDAPEHFIEASLLIIAKRLKPLGARPGNQERDSLPPAAPIPASVRQKYTGELN